MKLGIEKMIKSQPEDMKTNKIMSLIEDTLRYFDEEGEDEYKTNQHFVGIQNLFRGCIVKTWIGANFSKKSIER